MALGIVGPQASFIKKHLVAEFISPKKVYTFSFTVGDTIPKSVKCIHSATKKEFTAHMGRLCDESNETAHGKQKKNANSIAVATTVCLSVCLPAVSLSLALSVSGCLSVYACSAVSVSLSLPTYTCVFGLLE